MATVGSIIVDVKAYTAAFEKKMKRSAKSVRSFSKANKRLAETVKTVAMSFGAYFGARAIGRFLINAAKASAAFEKNLALVNTMLDKGSADYLPKYRKQLVGLSLQFGQTTETLSKGLYDILSAGFGASGAMDMLEVATRAAIGGATDTATAVDGLTTVLNAYQLQAEDAAYVSDIMFAIVKDGKIRYSELADNIGKLAPAAKAAGMSLEDMAAAIATLVKVEKPERAFVALRAAMMTATQQGRTLFSMVKELQGASLKEIMDAGFQKRSASAVAILTNNYKELTEEIRRMADATGEAGEATGKMLDTQQMNLDKLGTAWTEFTRVSGGAIWDVAMAAREAGEFALPHLKQALGMPQQTAGLEGAQYDAEFYQKQTERIERQIAIRDKMYQESQKAAIDAEIARLAPIGDINKKLQDQIATYGMLKPELEIYKLLQKGVTHEELARTQALFDYLAGLEKQTVAMERAKQATQTYTSTMQNLWKEYTLLTGRATEQEWTLFDMAKLGATTEQLERVRQMMEMISAEEEKREKAGYLEGLVGQLEGLKYKGGIGQGREISRGIDIKGLAIGGDDAMLEAQKKTNRLLEEIRNSGGLN